VTTPRINLLICLALLASSFLTVAIKHEYKNSEVAKNIRFETIIPKKFGDWTEVPITIPQINLGLAPDGDPTADNPYDDILTRTYSNSKQQEVMLTLAYGQLQRQEIKIHRPEFCYSAQGFQINSLTPIDININGKPVPVKIMATSSPQRSELVIYWIRIGDIIPETGWQARYYIFKQGLRKHFVDGILVRTSQVMGMDLSAKLSLEVQKSFLNDFINAIPLDQRHLIVPNRLV
jgi:EpsI family protein